MRDIMLQYCCVFVLFLSSLEVIRIIAIAVKLPNESDSRLDTSGNVLRVPALKFKID